MSETAKLELNGQTYELPVITGTENEKALDISQLRASSGLITMDIGFVNTGSCHSGVTFLNGEKGILRYRGYPIEQLAEKSNFAEVSYLLYNGELPNKNQLEEFRNNIKKSAELPQQIENIIDQFPITAHPMGVISAACASLAGFYPEYLAQEYLAEQKQKVFAQLMGQLKVIASRFYRRAQDLQVVKSDPALNFSEDFLNLMFGGKDYVVDKEIAEALDVLLILHADHEQNCSTSTVRVIGSSKANVFASVAGGIDALWGQLHGGANQAVLEMLEQIQKDGGDYKKFLDKAKDKNDPFRLMGFGHRVYKNFDPRAKIIKKACDNVLSKLGVKDQLLDIAKGLEEEALKDPYFVERKLYPNVDFYSGIIYRALGIPTNMFTVMFVLGRLPGWMAQWKEMTETPGMKIARPRQIYTGYGQREFINLDNR
ncbi:MAG: citrate synthase [Halobacteriovoraceae bacterium]|nr:citrate synthase [Halobacteriovoraceae bacterium]